MNSQASLFLKKVELGSSKVQYPEDVVFLCGGPVGTKVGSLQSLRDFIHWNRDDVFQGKKVLLAERAAAAFDSRMYDDLLDFEADIASISRLVLLISESPGSIAELGAFSQIEGIRENLLVFIHSQHFQQNSFIKDGPIRFLLNKNEQSVQEFSWLTKKSGALIKDSAIPLLKPLKSSIAEFLGRLPRTGRFQSARSGHTILLVAGLVRLLACSKLREIAAAMDALGLPVEEKSLKKMLFCLELFGWVRVVKRETSYYVYAATNDPFLFRGRGAYAEFDPIRVRFDILSGYDPLDPRLAILDSVTI